MPRTKRGPASRGRRKSLLKKAKGYSRGRNTKIKIAKETVMRALRYAKRDRRVRKRNFRNLWVIRIGAASRALGISYSRLMDGLQKEQVRLDRKILAYLACQDPQTFQALVELAKEQSAAESRRAA